MSYPKVFSKFISSLSISGTTITITYGDGSEKTVKITKADSATSATNDAKSQQIDSTYIKELSVSGSKLVLTRGDGSTSKISLPASDGTGGTSVDENVLQTVLTTDAEYPLLASSVKNGTKTTTDSAVFGSGITLNPKNSAITANAYFSNGNVNIKNASVVKGDNVGTFRCRDIRFVDGSDLAGDKKLTGMIRNAVNTDNSTYTCLYAYQFASDTSTNARIGVYQTSDGKSYTYAPTPDANDDSTKIATTEWVQTYCGTTKKFLTSATLSDYAKLANTIKSLSISGKTITYTKGDGKTDTLTTQDSEVKQTVLTTDGEYPLLASSVKNGAETVTTDAIFGAGMTINPKTNALTAKTFYSNGIYLKYASLVKGTNPNSFSTRDIRFIDNSTLSGDKKLTGMIRNAVDENGNTYTGLFAYLNESDSSVNAKICVYYPASGDPYTYAPTPTDENDKSTKIATTAWVQTYCENLQLASSSGSTVVSSPDVNVKQTLLVSDGEYPLLASAVKNASATTTDSAVFKSGVTLNPKNSAISASIYNCDNAIYIKNTDLTKGSDPDGLSYRELRFFDNSTSAFNAKTTGYIRNSVSDTGLSLLSLRAYQSVKDSTANAGIDICYPKTGSPYIQFTTNAFGQVLNMGTGTAIDVAKASVFRKDITADTTFTITGTPSGKAATFSLCLIGGQDKVITWPSSVRWTNSQKPTLSDGVDVFTFVTYDGGSNWFATISVWNS